VFAFPALVGDVHRFEVSWLRASGGARSEPGFAWPIRCGRRTPLVREVAAQATGSAGTGCCVGKLGGRALRRRFDVPGFASPGCSPDRHRHPGIGCRDDGGISGVCRRHRGGRASAAALLAGWL